LSGGIDSGLLLSQAGEGQASFCAGFAQGEYDERALARKTAEKFESPAELYRPTIPPPGCRLNSAH